VEQGKSVVAAHKNMAYDLKKKLKLLKPESQIAKPLRQARRGFALCTAYDNRVRSLQRFAVLILVVMSIGCFCARAESVSQLPMPTSYVQDFAGVIDADSKQEMEQLGREVWLQAKAKIIVVTIHSLGGVSIEEFATDLEDKWKVGAKGADRGVLMIL